MPFEKALRVSTTHRHDYVVAYTSDLDNVVDMEAIRGAKLSLGVDPLGGARVLYWGRIAERYGLNLTVINEAIDPTEARDCITGTGRRLILVANRWRLICS